MNNTKSKQHLPIDASNSMKLCHVTNIQHFNIDIEIDRNAFINCRKCSKVNPVFILYLGSMYNVRKNYNNPTKDIHISLITP